MSRLLSSVLAIVLFCAVAVYPAHGHGNNPPQQWTGVTIADIDPFAIPTPLYDYMQLLIPDALCGVADANACAELAISICGEGNICCFCVIGSNGDVACSFSCRDSEGNCEPCPTCGDMRSE